MQEQEQQEHEVLEEEEDEEEPVFVLTDEWKELFAKSEAIRKLGSSLFLNILFLHRLLHSSNLIST